MSKMIRPTTSWLAFAAVVLVGSLLLLLGGASKARAESFQFCYGVNVAPGGNCETNTAQLMNQAYAYGENGGVCVAVRPNPAACAGPNQGVYSPIAVLAPQYATIGNSVNQVNTVHGFYFTP
jgi:hypothetical protein